MKHRILITLIAALLVCLGLTAVQAQTGGATDPAYAFVADGSIYNTDTAGNTATVMNAGTVSHMDWNADGSKLAFLLRDANYVARIGIYDVASGQSFVHAPEGLDTGFTLNWTLDGRVLYAAFNPATDPGGNGYIADVFAMTPEQDAQPELIGTFPYGVGCGGGSPFPVDWTYNTETAGLGGFFLTLADTPFGIVHSMDCGGSSLGLMVRDSGESTVVAANLSKVVVSPDATRAAGVELNYEDRAASRLMVYDLATLEGAEVPTIAEPEQVFWSEDGAALYYVVRTADSALAEGLSEDDAIAIRQMFGFEPDDFPAYAASIQRVDVASGETSEIYNAYVYAIARVYEIDGVLYIVEVPNMDAWLAGMLNPQTDASGNPVQDFNAISPVLMRLDLSTSDGPAFMGWSNLFTPVLAR